MTVADYRDPEVVVDGSLFVRRMEAGDSELELPRSRRSGSGLRRISVQVNGIRC